MKTHPFFHLVVTAVFAAAASAPADVIVLYNGQRLAGEIIAESEQEISLRQESTNLPGLAYIRKIQRFDIRQVERSPRGPGSRPASEPAGPDETAAPVRPDEDKLNVLNSAITKWEQQNYAWAGFLLARLINTSTPGELAFMSAEVRKKLNISLAELAAQSHFKAAEPAKPGQRLHLPYVTVYERPALLKILKREHEEALGRHIDPVPQVVKETTVKTEPRTRRPETYSLTIIDQENTIARDGDKGKSLPSETRAGSVPTPILTPGTPAPGLPSSATPAPLTTPPQPVEPPPALPGIGLPSAGDGADRHPLAPATTIASKTSPHFAKTPGTAVRTPTAKDAGHPAGRPASRPAVWPAQRPTTIIDWLERPEEYDGTKAEAEAMINRIQYMSSLLSERSRLDTAGQRDPTLRTSLVQEKQRLALLLRAVKAAAKGALTPQERAAILAERKRLEQKPSKGSPSREALIEEFVKQGRKDGPPPGKYPTTAPGGNVIVVPVDVNFP